jgi:hypothetical protein
MFRRLFSANSDGTVKVRLEEPARDLVKSLTEELRELLLVDETDDVRRLYPTAYTEDAERDTAFRAMVHDQLLMSRLDAIDVVQATLDNNQLSAEEADAWMSTINQIRLVLGTRLDVSEDDREIDEDDPNVTNYVVYQVLSHMLDELTTARSAGL